jgi:tRNA (guanine-N7-)-methyltransferase
MVPVKPKNLKFPFTWEERQPAVHEGVLIVPQHYDRHHLWEVPEGVFPEGRPICVEFCSGNGDWILEKAKKYPERFWIAVEMQFERVRKIWSKMRNMGVENLLIVCGMAQEFAKFYLPKNLVDEMYVNFPDPWPKERHAKHRLIQTSFIDWISPTMKRGGKATFATDDPPYSQQMIEVMLSHPHWQASFEAPHYIQDWQDYGDSWFKNLWEGKGRNFFYMQFERL